MRIKQTFNRIRNAVKYCVKTGYLNGKIHDDGEKAINVTKSRQVLVSGAYKHRSLTLFLFLYLYTLYVVKGRTVTPLLHKLFLGELHCYYSGYNIVRIPFE